MYKKGRYTILSNVNIAKDVWQMILEGDTRYLSRPGQFVNILVQGHFLRRPISVCDYDAGTMTLIYKVFGSGTEALSKMNAGAELDLLTGLGNGFDISVPASRPLLVGGGVGVPPLYRLCKELADKGSAPIVVLGFNTEKEIFYADKFAEIPGTTVLVATMDGSCGFKGLVTDLIMNSPECRDADYLFTCGPTPMLKALHALPFTGQFSFEERMGCGFGGCMGCTHKTTEGYKRVCLEGPVFRKEEIVW